MGSSDGGDTVERRGRTEARLNRLEDQMLLIRAETESHVKGALSSFNSDMKTTHEHLVAEIERLDTLVRGENGDNGLTSRVRRVTEALENSKRRAAVFEGAFITSVIGVVVGLVVRLIMAGQ